MQSLNYYSVPFYETNQTVNAKNPTFSLQGIDSDEIDLSMQCIGYISGSGSSTCTFKAPLDNTLATSTTSSSGNCINLGTYDYANVQGITNIESGYTLTSSTSSYHLKPKTVLEIETDIINLTFFQQDSIKDLNNHVKNFLSNRSFITGSANLEGFIVGNVIGYTNNSLDCSNNKFEPQSITNQSWGCDGGGDGAWRTFYFMRLFPFNSSNSGLIYYNVSISNVVCEVKSGGSCASGYQIGYFEIDKTKSVIVNAQTSEGTLNLNPNTIYVFYLASYSSGKGDGVGVGNCRIGEGNYNSTFTINIGTPNWDCGEWGECLLGVQSRLCIDLNGFLDNYIETRICYTIPEKSINIGFENSSEVNVFYSYPQWWVLTCPLFIGHKSVEYPSDWHLNNLTNPIIHDNATSPTITGYIADNLMISNEDSIEGIKSLKLWYLPPQLYLPICSDGIVYENKTCPLTPYGNYTTGQFPFLYKPINETYMLSRDISFDYPNMTLTAYIKKCSDPVQEWDGDVLTWGENYSLITCGDGYYTTDKTSEWEVSTTKLFFQIYNYNTSTTLMNVRFVADLEKWKKVQIRLLNMTTTDLFKFNLGISSESPVDSNVYCAYIDNVELNAYTGAIPCNSYCEGKTYYRATQISDYGCAYNIEEVSPLCVSPKQEMLIGGCQSFCECNSEKEDYLTYYIADNSTNTCIWTLQPESDYCSEYCATQDIKTTDAVIQEILESKGLGFLGNFFTAMFIIIMILVGIAFAITYILSKGKQNVSWQIFVIVMIIQLLVVSILWVEFSFIGIIIVVILALFLAKTYSSGSNSI